MNSIQDDVKLFRELIGKISNVIIHDYSVPKILDINFQIPNNNFTNSDTLGLIIIQETECGNKQLFIRINDNYFLFEVTYSFKVDEKIDASYFHDAMAEIP